VLARGDDLAGEGNEEPDEPGDAAPNPLPTRSRRLFAGF
jgi:hypothetical protein